MNHHQDKLFYYNIIFSQLDTICMQCSMCTESPESVPNTSYWVIRYW